MPAVSVVITIYNRADTLARAIHSVQAQSFQDWELLLIDDGSTDNSVELAKSYLSDPRIRLVVNAKNRGIGGAKNVGIAQASGKFVAFLDSDDEWLPLKLERQLAWMVNNPLQHLCFTGFYVARPGREDRLERVPVKRNASWLSTVVQGVDVALGSTLFARRQLFAEIGVFDEAIRRMEDRDWIIRYLCVYSEFGVVSEPLACIYTGGFPKAELIRASAKQLVAINAPRLAGQDSRLPKTFEAALEFDAAVAEYRAGRPIAGMLSAIRSMTASPLVAAINVRRVWRKLVNRDFA